MGVIGGGRHPELAPARPTTHQQTEERTVPITRRSPTRRLISVVAMILALGGSAYPGPAAASAPPAGSLTMVVGAQEPLALAWRPGNEALYVVEQRGTILLAGSENTTPVLDVSDLVSNEAEQGLLGLAFAPDGHHAYINYTDTEGDTVVAELAVSEDGSVFDRDNMRTVITVDQPYANHNGGQVTFGPDGMLYIGMGDGGDGGDPQRHAQNMDSLLGKMLRIDPTPSGDQGYTVPDDNPFAGTEGVRGEIWSVGLRNPWRFSFDAETGDLWIADVGENTSEEVNVALATNGLDAGKGTNFGWSAYEGDNEYNSDVTVEDHHSPIYAYAHEDGRCSISGGVRARGERAGAFAGWYIFAELCTGEVFALGISGEGADLAAGEIVNLPNSSFPRAVVSAPDGALYVVASDGIYLLESS